MFRRIRETYRRTEKPRDILWNRFVARPLAALFVAALERSRVTPNQITLASLAVFLVSAALLVLLPGQSGLLIAVGVLQLSYVLDCVDGQLARLRGTSSPVGAHLDFLMDEIKAFALVAATGARLWSETGSERFLLEATVALGAVASGISLTTFVRRPEYGAATGQTVSQGSGDYGQGLDKGSPPAPARRSLLRRMLGAVEALGRFLIHYPSYIVFVALANRLDLFLHVYFAINAAYAARTFLVVTWKLGGPAAPRG